MQGTSAPPPKTSLPKTPGVSLHRQLYLVLRDRIVRAQWRAGDALPPEDALCVQFDVSRITVRRALGDLVAEGLLERRHGLGTFVLGGAPAPRPHVSLSLLDGLRKTTLETQVQVLSVEHGVPPHEIADQLQLAPGEKATHALRLRYRDAVPLMVTDAWVPDRVGAKVSAAALKKNALYEILLEKGVKFGRVVQEITAEAADPEYARLLQTAAGAPLLVLARLIHDLDAKPVQHLRVYMSSERSRILMDIPGVQINTLTSGQIVHDPAGR